jgi:FdhD protein
MAMIPPPRVPMPGERRTALVLNGAELLTIQTTPVALDDWAVGFLYTEGIIRAPGELQRLTVDTTALRVEAEVEPRRLEDLDLSGKRYLTSGCGKGVTFSSVRDAMLLQPVRHDLAVSTDQLLAWIRQMQRHSPLYSASGGMHAAAAVHVPTGTQIVREDIGRHNAVDKAIGAALRAGWAPAEVVFLTTGRISYEMCAKLARFGAGVGASLTAATDQAIRLAGRLGIDLVGYVRKPEKIRLYTGGSRIRPGN